LFEPDADETHQIERVVRRADDDDFSGVTARGIINDVRRAGAAAARRGRELSALGTMLAQVAGAGRRSSREHRRCRSSWSRVPLASATGRPASASRSERKNAITICPTRVARQAAFADETAAPSSDAASAARRAKIDGVELFRHGDPR